MKVPELRLLHCSSHVDAVDVIAATKPLVLATYATTVVGAERIPVRIEGEFIRYANDDDDSMDYYLIITQDDFHDLRKQYFMRSYER